MSYNQLTELTGFTYRTLKKRMNGAEPVGRNQSKASVWDSKEVLPMIYARTVSPTDNGKPTGRIEVDERAALVRAQRIGQEIKNAKDEGNLIPASEVAIRWGRIITAAQRHLLSLPDRLNQLIETAPTPEERREVIEREIKIVLKTLAQPQKGESNDVGKN